MKNVIVAAVIMCIISIILVIMSTPNKPTAKITPYQSSKTEESSCSMPMCESLGGHDAIALQVMFGD